MQVRDIREPVLTLLPPIFRHCCAADDDGRYSLFAPFLCGEWTNATDGRIFVRMPSPPGVREILALITEPRHLPTPEKLYEDLRHSSEPTALPDLPGGTPCPDCTATGKAACDLCGQLGKCTHCDGRGFYFDPEGQVRLSPQCHIGLRYAYILKSHEAEVYLPVPATGKPIKFVVGKADGLLMPLSPEDPGKP